MMRLRGVVEFLSFSRVCKSWRSLALSNRKMFMASKPPMLMFISPGTCCLQDFEGRKFKTMIPQLVGRECVGLSCGYLILFGEKACDFWLVNPITGHELHFPGVPFDVKERVRDVLVFSPSLNSWVFVMSNRMKYGIWFSIAGKAGAWNHVYSTSRILDLHAFKGKIYSLNCGVHSLLQRSVCELRLDPDPVPKLRTIDTHFVDSVSCVYDFVSSDENLYVMEFLSLYAYKVHKLGFDEMIWTPCEKTREEYVLLHSGLKFSAAVKPESWPSSWHGRFFDAKRRGEDWFYCAKRWYFPHDCLNVNYILSSHR